MLEYGSSLRTLTRASPTEGSGAGKREVLCQTSLVQHQKVNVSSPIPAPRYPKGLPSGRAERYPLGRRQTQGREGDFKSKRCPQGSQNRQTEKSPPGAHQDDRALVVCAKNLDEAEN